MSQRQRTMQPSTMARQTLFRRIPDSRYLGTFRALGITIYALGITIYRSIAQRHEIQPLEEGYSVHVEKKR